MNKTKINEHNSNFVLTILIAVEIVIIVVLFFSVSYNIHSSNYYKQLYLTETTRKKQLKEKAQVLTTNLSEITSGKFDLQAKQKRLNTIYTLLIRSLFGDARSTDIIKNDENKYIQYFGKKGWKLLENIAFSNGKKKIAKTNDEVKIAFLDFKIPNITVVAYTKFQLLNSKEKKCGIAYITTHFNFKNNSAFNTSVEIAFPQNDN